MQRITETCNKPTESRNKREGRYAGRIRVYNLSADRMGPARHRRADAGGYFLPLRHPGDSWAPGPHAHHYGSWSCA